MRCITKRHYFHKESTIVNTFCALKKNKTKSNGTDIRHFGKPTSFFLNCLDLNFSIVLTNSSKPWANLNYNIDEHCCHFYFLVFSSVIKLFFPAFCPHNTSIFIASNYSPLFLASAWRRLCWRQCTCSSSAQTSNFIWSLLHKSQTSLWCRGEMRLTH